jgi:hypothetical protein
MTISETPAELVQRAFDLARYSGKDPWNVMTVPVLKNRIIQLTKGTFRESDFGVKSFKEFLFQLPEGVVTLDESKNPTIVVLVAGAATAHRGQVRAQVRRDLWRSILDYSSGRKYVWDVHSSQARPSVPGDEPPYLPTVTPQELSTWRNSFASLHIADASGDDLLRLIRWKDENLPTELLPRHLRPAWNAALKQYVADRALHWFQENGIVPPDDIVGIPVDNASSLSPRAESASSLRELAVACVRVMTDDELRSLAIPIRVVIRAQASGRKLND